MNPQDPYAQTPPQPQQPAADQPMGAYPPPQTPQQSPPSTTPTPQPQPLGDLQTTQPGQPYPSDYLDTIAVQQPQKTMNKFMLFSLIGAGILAALIAVFMLSSMGKQPNFSEQAAIVNGRLATLQAVVDEHQKHLTDNRLRVTNATFSATITTMSQDVGEIAKAKNIKLSKKPSATEKEYLTKLQSTLNDAYLLGSLDRTYPTEMAYQITILKTQLRRMKSQANSKAVNDFYTARVASLEQISKEFSDFIGDK